MMDEELKKAAEDFVWETMENDYDGPSELRRKMSHYAKIDDFYNGLEEFFIAGAKWMEAHTPLPEDTVLFNKGVEEGKRLAEEEQADLFTVVALDAAQRTKNKIMEDAKEGKIIFLLNGDVAVNIGDTDEYKLGQKVRIIILKENEK